MTKLVVEVHNATDLMPKDGQGSASPFVEVDFDDQRQRTQTKPKDLNPHWNEKLVFNVSNPNHLLHSTLNVTVYNDSQGKTHRKNFLGRVRISGASVPLSESEALHQRYPLDKRDIFQQIKGDIALRIYAAHDYTDTTPIASNVEAVLESDTPLREINPNRIIEGEIGQIPDPNFASTAAADGHKMFKKKKKEKEVRTFHSIGTAAGGGVGGGHSAPAAAMSSGFAFDTREKPMPVFETRRDYAQAGPAAAATVMRMQVPRQNPEFALVETRPPLAARLRYRGGDKTASTYDLVEQMHYLYVSVVKARDLPVMDITGSLDPYVEVKLGNYKGVTKHWEKNQNPVWKQIFAFSKERLQSNLLEVTVKDKDFAKDDFVGRVHFDLSEVPLRVPPDSPLAPQWYKLEDKHGMKTKGEIMLAVWMGTQADESFPEAWHSDAHNVSHVNLANTRSKVYFSPKLYYLRVHVIEAQDLVPSDRSRVPTVYVKVISGKFVK